MKNIAKKKLITADVLVDAYCNGYFPMADSNTGEIAWYSPDPRTIFDLQNFNTPKSVNSVIKKNIFNFTVNTQFEEVIRACSCRKETWISEVIIQSYLELFNMGLAHSVETWHNNVLVGGLYGVSIGGAFFGESMFSKVSNASKVALVFLVKRLQQRDFQLLDTQYNTEHLKMFGSIEIPKKEYLLKLNEALKIKRSFL